MKKNNKSENVLIIQKYKGSRVGIISMIITLCISIVCYIIVLFLLQSRNINKTLFTVISMCRDVLLAIVSIIGTSLLTSVFIEKNKKNIDYTEMIANDIFASPDFYSNLTDENKEKMNRYLEENIYSKDPIKSEINQLCRKKIYDIASNYYYTELNMNVSYFDNISFSEKKIRRVMKLRSYRDNIEERKLCLFSYNLSPTQDVKNFEVLSAGIGEENDVLEIGKDIIIEKKVTRDLLWDKCGYTETYNVYLCKSIILNAQEDTILNVEYVSRVTDEDMSAGFGVFVPCKKFYLNFLAPQNYIIYAHPHAFLNSKNNFSNSLYRNSLSVCFNDWLLPGEGVAISLAKSN